MKSNTIVLEEPLSKNNVRKNPLSSKILSKNRVKKDPVCSAILKLVKSNGSFQIRTSSKYKHGKLIENLNLENFEAVNRLVDVGICRFAHLREYKGLVDCVSVSGVCATIVIMQPFVKKTLVSHVTIV